MNQAQAAEDGVSNTLARDFFKSPFAYTFWVFFLIYAIFMIQDS